jgi:hypothetical protein
MCQGISGFLLMCSKFYPDMFWQVVAIFRGSYVPYTLLKQCVVGVYGLRSVQCGQISRTDHNPYTPTTQTLLG